MDIGYDLYWGNASDPTLSSALLKLPEHLPNVPQNGTVVDLGAGIAHSMASAIYVTRPDITVLSVDAGYALDEEEENVAIMRENILGCYPPAQRAFLESNDSWLDSRIASYAEDLPLESEIADLVVSYAAIPEYSEQPELAFDEMIRILKVGGIALNGPVTHPMCETWGKLIESKFAEGVVSSISQREERVSVNEYTHNDMFTVIRK